MKIVILTIVTMYLTLTVSAECATSQDIVWSDVLASDERERSFETPDDIRSHLDNLSNYYAIVGRPRFGKRNFNRDLLSLRNIRNKLPDKYWHLMIRILESSTNNNNINNNNNII